MCGIAGVYHFTSINADEIHHALHSMVLSLNHRGPNSDGMWVDPKIGLGLGHKRLAIQDLSPAGHQPMGSADGRFMMVFNGEIYNHLLLRKALLKDTHIDWCGHSDTETLLASFSFFGIDKTLSLIDGMFAIALWDKYDNQLYLIRDRAGEKPLYYGFNQDIFFFGSELKALKKHPQFNPQICHKSLALYLSHGNIPAPYSIYENIYKVSSGEIIKISANKDIKKHCYWDAKSLYQKAQKNIFKGSRLQAVNKLEDHLFRIIDQQILADVSVGAFLSGGVDSSSIVAMMCAQISSEKVKTFTIGFTQQDFNEAVYANEVAKHLGTDHTEIYIESDQVRNFIPDLPLYYDEPFADSSQLPMLIISKLTQQHVAVVLSGDGGDELFAGYNRHKFVYDYYAKIQNIPQFIRSLMAKICLSLTPVQWDKLQALLPNHLRQSLFGDKIYKIALALISSQLSDLYSNVISHSAKPWDILHSHDDSHSIILTHLSELSDTDMLMLWDYLHYLPNDILTKVDRASMAFSLETRVPFLDHKLTEYAWSLPVSYKIYEGKSKWVLRQLLYRHVPKKLIERPKMGFAVPVAKWLRGPLKEWGAELLFNKSLQDDGLFNVNKIETLWHQHMNKKHNHHDILWKVLMFQLWKNSGY